MDEAIPTSDHLDSPDDIIVRIRTGDAQALGQLMQLHSGNLLRLATAITGSHDSAKEVVQDVFMWLWSQGPDLDIRGDVRGYLWNATRNRARNVVRHEDVQQRLSNTLASSAGMPRVAQNSATEHLEAEDLAAEVYAGLANLPKRCQEIFLLSWRDGFTKEEIAVALEIGVPTVRNQIARAVRAVAEHIKGKGLTQG